MPPVQIDGDSERLPIARIEEAIDANFAVFRRPGVVAVRSGYQFTNAWITKKPAIVVYVRHKRRDIAPGEMLPDSVGDFAVDVRQAPPHLQLDYGRSPDRLTFPLRLEAFSTGYEAEPEEDAVPQIPYVPPAGVTLAEITEGITIRCSAGPDAGFPELKTFLESTAKRLTIGMYEFSVKHIVNALLNGLKTDRPLQLVLDSKEDAGGEITEVELFDLLHTKL